MTASKAWVVYEKDMYYEALFLIHAETSGKAKVILRSVWPDWGYPDFIDLRTKRKPTLDNQPFTETIVGNAGIYAIDSDEPPGWWGNFCPCDLCKEVTT